MKKVISNLDPIPWGYGIAYPIQSWKGFACYPIPLNWIVGQCRRLYHAVQQALVPSCFDARLLDALTHERRRVMAEEIGDTASNSFDAWRAGAQSVERNIAEALYERGYLFTKR